MKGLNTDFLGLYVHMTSVEKTFNKVFDYVKEVEGINKFGKAKVLTTSPRCG